MNILREDNQKCKNNRIYVHEMWHVVFADSPTFTGTQASEMDPWFILYSAGMFSVCLL